MLDDTHDEPARRSASALALVLALAVIGMLIWVILIGAYWLAISWVVVMVGAAVYFLVLATQRSDAQP